jgi:hypothetical protein
VTLQDREIIDLLRRLERLSWGSTTAWNASTARGKPGSRALTFGHDLPPHEHYRREYDHARGEKARDIVITDARRELYAWMKRPGGIKYREPAWGTVAKEIVDEGRGDPPEIVAIAKRTTTSLVRKARREFKCDEETGLPNPTAAHPDWRQEAERLQAGGATVRVISDRVGVPRATVGRALRKAS